MKIRVTREQIRKGKPQKGRRCPVALAIRKAGIRGASVGGVMLYHGFRKIVLPKRVQRFIRRFDAGLPVKPFTFLLNI